MRYVGFRGVSVMVLLGVCALFLPVFPAWAESADPDVETHRVLGTLYALAAAANLYGAEGGALPDPERLERYFQKESLPSDGLGAVRIDAFSEGWWLGVPVGITSTARKFLRAHAPELRVFEAPGGAPWMGSSVVWLEAVRFEGGKKPKSKSQPNPKPQPKTFAVGIAEGQGADRDALFFNAAGTEGYWWTPLRFTPAARAAVLKRWGRPAAGLTVPQEREAERESFRASPVGLPEEFSVSSDQEPGSSMEVGDVIFNPIPRPRSQ